MYIHGIVDGVLAVLVLELATLIIIAALYAKKKGK